MSNQISSVTQGQSAEQIAAAQTKAAESKAAQTPQTSQTSKATPTLQAAQTPTDTVQISAAASKAILQEAEETHAQTVKEANAGDAQAKRLLAKEAAAAFQPKT